MYKLIGWQRKTGVFDGKNYDNFVLHCVAEADSSKNEVGQICNILKVKAPLISFSLDIGMLITPYYDKFGRIQQIVCAE